MIIEAVRRVVERCRKANPDHMNIPVDGAHAMEWLLEELLRLEEKKND